MNKPLVSVVVPIYNAEKYLEETIESIINQTYQNLEILLINHNSTDDSISIINNYEEGDSRIKVINLDINKGGPAYPRNVGIENSNGEYIAFLDSDDVWLPKKLEKQVRFMLENNLNFSSTNAVNIDEYSNIISLFDYFKNYIRGFRKCNYKTFIKYNFIYLSSVIIKKELSINFNEEEYCISVEDYYLWLQLLNNKQTKYRFFQKNLLFYRIVDNSISDRNIAGKQKARAMYYLSKFILENNKFELLK